MTAAPGASAKLQFTGANIVTNAGTIVLSGPGAAIVDEHGVNALTNFSHHLNFIRFTDGATFTAANNFTNEGFFVVRPGCTATFAGGYTAIAGPNLFDFPGNVEVFGTEFGPSTGNGLFDVTGGTFGNFDAATKTLMDARFRLASTGAATATLRFPGADIVHNAAQLEVVGPNTNILDENGNNGLRNFASNSFYFALARRLLTVPGDFVNSGPMELYGGGQFTVTGNMSSNEYLALYAYDIHLNFIAPGFDPAEDFALSSKIAVNGNLTLGANSYLLFEVLSSKITTAITANGAASVAGYLDLYCTFDDSLITPADTFTLLQANLGITGTFDNVASGQRIDALSYDTGEPFGSFLLTNSGTALTLSDYQAVPQLTAAASRKSHGSVGTFDIDLPLAGAPGVECRDGGGVHTLIFTFNKEIVSGSAALSSGSGSVTGTPVIAGNTMTVALSGVSDVQQIAVNLSGVTDAVGQTLPDTVVALRLLIGDTTGDGMVGASDIGQTKAQSGTVAGAANFRADINTSGTINASDLGQVKSNSGHSVTASARTSRTQPAKAAARTARRRSMADR